MCSNRQGEQLREVENLLERSRYNRRADRDYTLHHKNDNNRQEGGCCETQVAQSLGWLKAPLQLRKALVLPQKGEADRKLYQQYVSPQCGFNDKVQRVRVCCENPKH